MNKKSPGIGKCRGKKRINPNYNFKLELERLRI